MLIGELAEKTGFPRDTIRYYEKRGLIQLDRKQRRENDYKEYPEYLVDRLLFMQKLKDYGFTLNEIRLMIELYDEELLECEYVEDWVAQKIDGIGKKIEQLQSIQHKLIQLSEAAARCEDNKCRLDL